MATKNAKPAQPGTQAQLPDSKGVNAVRDAKRTKGGGAAVPTKGQGTGKFRKGRRTAE